MVHITFKLAETLISPVPKSTSTDGINKLMSIQFYTGRAQDLYTTPSKFTDAPAYVTLLKSTYDFDAAHSLDDVLLYASGDPTPLASKVVYTSGDNKIFDAADVQLDVPENIQVKYILIYYTDSSILKPACIIHTSVNGLPGTPKTGSTTLSFSSALNKIFKISNSYIGAEGSHLVVFNDGPAPHVKIPDNAIRGQVTPTGAELRAPGNSKRNLYSDLSLSSRAHPLSGDAAVFKEKAAINQSLRNLILTSPGERPFSGLDIGGGINDLLFELSHPGLVEDLERSIATTINNFEPRAILQDVNVRLIPEKNAASIRITYSIRMTNTTETFDLFLERA